MMFNERYCIVYYAINLLCYKHWIGKWKYLTHISVIRKVLKSCRIKIVYLAHDVHGASSLYIKPCWQSLYRVFPPGGMGKSPHQPKNCSCTPSPPNVYSPPPPPPPPPPSTHQKWTKPNKKSVIFDCSHCSCTIFVLISYSFETRIMLISILIDVQ